MSESATMHESAFLSRLLGLAVAMILPFTAISATAQPTHVNSANDLLEATVTMEDIAVTLGDEDSQALLRAAEQLIRRLTPEEISAIGVVDYSVVTGKLHRLRANLPGGLDSKAAHALAATPSSNGILFDPLPDAEYPVVCGDMRTDAETVKLVALEALLVLEEAQALAEEALADVRHAALETLVVAGEGGNTSLVAEPFDIAVAVARILKVAAKATLEDLKFIDECIDSAEISGSYERLDALGERIEKVAVREIEADLADNRVLASSFLPAAHGGHLEAVRDIVQLWITRSADAGRDTQSAQRWFDFGLQRMAAQQYQRAYLAFARAYRLLGR